MTRRSRRRRDDAVSHGDDGTSRQLAAWARLAEAGGDVSPYPRVRISRAVLCEAWCGGGNLAV